jgi:hypothetical protein
MKWPALGLSMSIGVQRVEVSNDTHITFFSSFSRNSNAQSSSIR